MKATSRIIGTLLAGILLASSGPALATPSLPGDRYSWADTFGEPFWVQGYNSSWTMKSPFRDNKAKEIFPDMSLPYGQPDGGAENPHRGYDIDFRRTGTEVYAVAAGWASASLQPDGSYSVFHRVDFDENATADGFRVEYRHIVPDPSIPRDGRELEVTSSTLLGTVGRDGTTPRLQLCVLGNKVIPSGGSNPYESYLKPYPFYRYAAGWNGGKDTSLINYQYYTSADGKMYLTAYRATPNGERIPPSEVVVFHDRLLDAPHGEGVIPVYQDPEWHLSTMTRLADQITYVFDPLTYEYSYPSFTFYYPKDGTRVHYICRVRFPFDTDPNAYVWSFSPGQWERPYEDVRDWKAAGYAFSSWYHYLPYEQLPHQWFSQQDPSQWDTRYSWDDTLLNKLFFPNLQPVYVNGVPDYSRSQMPFDWYAAEDGTAYEKGLVQKYGCVITSWAMILDNLSARTVEPRPDFRRGNVVEYLSPDPLTVTLANIQDFTVTENKAENRWESAWSGGTNPVSVVYGNLVREFGVTARWRQFFRTTLAEAVTKDQTTVKFADTSVVTGNGCYITVKSEEAIEVMQVLGADPGNPGYYLVSRGQAGTTGVPLPLGAVVFEGTEDQRAWIIHNLLTEDTDPSTPEVERRGQGIIVYFHCLDGSTHGMIFSESEITNFPYPDLCYDMVERWADIPPGPVPQEPSAAEPGAATISLIAPPSPFEQALKVCDPATPNHYQGADVFFSECASFPAKRLLYAEWIMVIEKP